MKQHRSKVQEVVESSQHPWASCPPTLSHLKSTKRKACNRDESLCVSSLVIDCPVPAAWEEAIVQREVSDNDSDGFAEFSAGDAAHLSLDSFCYYPPIQCSLVKSETLMYNVHQLKSETRMYNVHQLVITPVDSLQH